MEKHYNLDPMFFVETMAIAYQGQQLLTELEFFKLTPWEETKYLPRKKKKAARKVLIQSGLHYNFK